MKRLVAFLLAGFLLPAVPAFAQFTQLGHASAGSTDGDSVTTGAINVPAADLITVEVVEYIGAVTPITLSDSEMNSYSQCGSTHSNPSGGQVRLFYTQGAGVGSASFTVTGTGDDAFPSIFVQAWTGSDASPCDTGAVNGNNTASGTTLAPAASVTPAEDDSLLITAVVVDQARNFTINGGFTEQDEVSFVTAEHYGGSMAYLIQTTAASAQPTWDNNGAAAEMAVVIGTFKAAAAAGVNIPVIQHHRRQQRNHQ